MSDHIKGYPLSWPDAWPRAKWREASRFGSRGSGASINQSTREILRQLDLMGIPEWNVIISTNLELRLDGLPRANQTYVADPGVAVWFKQGDNRKVIAIDKYDKPGCNLRAVAKTLEAMRGIERWGGELLERVFTGFTALPSPETVSEASWRTVLGFDADEQATKGSVNAKYRSLCAVHHPDKGGSESMMHTLNAARKSALSELTT